jgi:hypothetical protein
MSPVSATAALATPFDDPPLHRVSTDDRLMLEIIGVILRRQDDLLAVLSTVATHEAALDELRRSISALAGARWEVERSRPRRAGSRPTPSPRWSTP